MEDLYDITRSVNQVKVRLPGIAEPVDAYSNGKSFFLTNEQVEALAAQLGADRVNRSSSGRWQEVVPDKGVRFLAERHIGDGVYYRFRKHWDFTVEL